MVTVDGLITVGAALAWFFVWIVALFPLLNDGPIQTRRSTPTWAARRAVSSAPCAHIRAASARAWRATTRRTTCGSFAPFGLMSLAAPLLLVLGAPQAFLNLITNVPWTKTITFHYVAMPLVGRHDRHGRGHRVDSARRIEWPDAARRPCRGRASWLVVATTAWGPSPVGELIPRWRLAPRRARISTSARAADATTIPGRRGRERDLQPRPPPDPPPGDLRVPQPLGVEELRYRRRAPAERCACRPDRRRPHVLDKDTSRLLQGFIDRRTFRMVFDEDEYVVLRRVKA